MRVNTSIHISLILAQEVLDYEYYTALHLRLTNVTHRLKTAYQISIVCLWEVTDINIVIMNF